MNKKLKTTWTVLNQNVFIVISIIFKNWCEKGHADLTVRSFSQQSGTFDPYSINYTTLILYLLYYTSNWEPSAARVTQIFSRRLPALERFYHETKFFAVKVETLNLESLNQAKNISVGPSSSPIKIWGQPV